MLQIQVSTHLNRYCFLLCAQVLMMALNWKKESFTCDKKRAIYFISSIFWYKHIMMNGLDIDIFEQLELRKNWESVYET